MKKLKQLAHVLFLIPVLTVASCSSDNDGSGGSVNAGKGTITAKVNGQTVTSATELTSGSISTGQFGMLAITGTNMQGDGFTITIAGFEGAKTYDVGGESSVFAVCSYIDTDMNNPTVPHIWSGPYDDGAIAGSVSVTEVTTTRVKGTFNFSGKNASDGTVKEVTSGSFDVKLNTF